MDCFFWIGAACAAMTFIGYTLSLRLLANVIVRHCPLGDLVPPISLIISAYNERNVIARKLDNALSLDYPKRLLEILVISDCSDDGTDEVVEGYADRGIKLFRVPSRQGKSHGLTRFFPQASGEIIVFTDANAIYEPTALRLLVRHFSDPQIGYVVGNQCYHTGSGTGAGNSEGAYTSHEERLKILESRISSVVGGDGAIYAIRKQLFQPLRDDDISDFVNPLQIVAAGYRGVYEPAARCFEEPAGEFGKEYRRKVRIVNRSLRGASRVPAVFNPFRVGWFAYQIFFHKLMRWFAPYFLAVMLAANIARVAVAPNWLYSMTLAAQLTGYGVAALYAVPGLRNHRIVQLAFYFVVVNAAAAVGTTLFLCGRRIVTWKPERTASTAKHTV